MKLCLGGWKTYKLIVYIMTDYNLAFKTGLCKAVFKKTKQKKTKNKWFLYT